MCLGVRLGVACERAAVRTDERRPSNSSTSITVRPGKTSVAKAPPAGAPEPTPAPAPRTTSARSRVTCTTSRGPANSSSERTGAFLYASPRVVSELLGEEVVKSVGEAGRCVGRGKEVEYALGSERPVQVDVEAARDPREGDGVAGCRGEGGESDQGSPANRKKVSRIRQPIGHNADAQEGPRSHLIYIGLCRVKKNVVDRSQNWRGWPSRRA
jgi:hypothetical protein